MTPKKSFRGKSDDAMQVLCSASAQQNYLHNTSTPIEEKALMLFKLCSASAQQNYLHNTSTAIEEKAVVLFKCCAAHRHNKTICTTHAQQSMGKDSCYGSVVQRIGTTKLSAQHKHSNRGKSGGAIQVLCSASAQQNYLHNTRTAIDGKGFMLWKCCAAHRHNKIICTTQAQQSRKKRWCYSSVVQPIGTTKLFAQHKHSNRGKSGGAIQVLCNTSAQQNLVVRLLCTPQSVVHSICTTKNRGWRRDSRCQRGKKFVRDRCDGDDRSEEHTSELQ